MNAPKSFHDDLYLGASVEYLIDAESLGTEGRFSVVRPRLPMQRKTVDVLEPYSSTRVPPGEVHPKPTTRWRLLRQCDTLEAAVTFARAEEERRSAKEAEDRKAREDARARSRAEENAKAERATKRKADEKAARDLAWARKVLAEEDARAREERERVERVEKARRIVEAAEAKAGAA